jgi:hypothetical protein
MTDPPMLPAPATAADNRQAFPPDWTPAALLATHTATRALLKAATPREVVDIVLGLVVTLGGEVIPARLAGADALSLDLSFGVDGPLLPTAEPASIPRLHLETLMPGFLEDSRHVLMELRHQSHLSREATCDPLTGLMTRRTFDRQLYQLRPGDAIALITFDHVTRPDDIAANRIEDTCGGCCTNPAGV